MSSAWSQPRFGGTISSVIVGLLASGAGQFDDKPAVQPTMSSYAGIDVQAPTAGLFSITQIATSALPSVDEVAEAASQAFKKFASEQIAMDPDISRIVSANLWDLYTRA